jgi:hypothetical protein
MASGKVTRTGVRLFEAELRQLEGELRLRLDTGKRLAKAKGTKGAEVCIFAPFGSSAPA